MNAKAREKTIPVTFSYRVMVNEADNVETGAKLARWSWRFGSRDVARARFEHAIAEAGHDGRIGTWLQLEGERYENEKSFNPPAVPLQQLREEARLGAQGLRESYSSRAGCIWVNAMFDLAYGPMLQDQLWARPAELAETSRSSAESLDTDVLGFSKDTGDKDNVFLQEIKLISQLSPFGSVAGSEAKREPSLAQLEQIYQRAGVGFTLWLQSPLRSSKSKVRCSPGKQFWNTSFPSTSSFVTNSSASF